MARCAPSTARRSRTRPRPGSRSSRPSGVSAARHHSARGRRHHRGRRRVGRRFPLRPHDHPPSGWSCSTRTTNLDRTLPALRGIASTAVAGPHDLSVGNGSCADGVRRPNAGQQRVVPLVLGFRRSLIWFTNRKRAASASRAALGPGWIISISSCRRWVSGSRPA
jgi:hypothetical protein